jgi:hypothetical protein
VIDMIRVLGGQKSAKKFWMRLKEAHPEVVALCHHFKFPGPGQRLTPVAKDKAAAYQILGHLPGACGDKYRKDAAELFVQALEQHWKDAQPMRLPNGEVMGPAEMFLAFTGELDLQLPEEREIPMDQEARVSQEFGKWVRMELAKRGVDFVVSDQQRLMQASPAFRELTTGKDLRGERLIEALPAGVEELWDVLGGLIT